MKMKCLAYIFGFWSLYSADNFEIKLTVTETSQKHQPVLFNILAQNAFIPVKILASDLSFCAAVMSIINFCQKPDFWIEKQEFSLCSTLPGCLMSMPY